MAVSTTSASTLQKNQRVSEILNKPKYVPTKELALERDKDYIFGICKRCKCPIFYPTIKVPGSCTEVSPEGLSTTARQYQVVYFDYHLSCAMQDFLEAQDVSINLEHNITSKSKMFKRFVEKNTSVTTKVSVDCIKS